MGSASTTYDQELLEDLKAICVMLAVARKHELETEVLMWFGNERANGYDTETACEMALAEWVK